MKLTKERIQKLMVHVELSNGLTTKFPTMLIEKGWILEFSRPIMRTHDLC